jgi:hypothetical protein
MLVLVRALTKLNTELAQVPPKDFNVESVRSLKATMNQRLDEFRKLLRADVPTATAGPDQGGWPKGFRDQG